MEVKDFVSQTIIEIIDGVCIAQEHAKKTGAVVNPALTSLRGMSLGPPGAQPIDFEIMVTISDNAQVKSGIQVYFPPLRAGMGGEDGSSTSTANRVKFSVPIVFPAQK